MEFDWGNLVEDWMVKIDGEIRPRRIVLGPREILVIPPIGVVCLQVRIMRWP